jgi:hypothetical protein
VNATRAAPGAIPEFTARSAGRIRSCDEGLAASPLRRAEWEKKDAERRAARLAESRQESDKQYERLKAAGLVS